jgi:hypothetical protein
MTVGDSLIFLTVTAMRGGEVMDGRWCSGNGHARSTDA